MPAAVAAEARPLVTCDIEATGAFVKPRVEHGTGEERAVDAGTASGVCVTLDGVAYSVTLTVTVQSFDGSWSNVCSAQATFRSTQGVAFLAPPPVASCQYSGADNAYLGRYHRSFAQLTTPSGSYQSTSGTWFAPQT